MSASPVRCLTVWLAATAVAAGLESWLLPVACDGSADGAFDVLVVRLCAAVAVLGIAWLWAAASATVAEALRDSSRPTRGVPHAVRRWVLAACGAGLAAGLLTPSLAGSASATPGDVHTERGPASSLAGLPLPDRAVGLPGRASIGTGPLRHPDQVRDVVVRVGDTLWDIAAHHLGDPRRWPEVYALNEAVIGTDPDVIHPATRLRLPADRLEETP